MRPTRKQRRKKALQKALLARIKIVNMGQRPTVVCDGIVVHAPFCGHREDGKPIYEKLTKKSGQKLQQFALGVMRELRPQIQRKMKKADLKDAAQQLRGMGQTT